MLTPKKEKEKRNTTYSGLVLLEFMEKSLDFFNDHILSLYCDLFYFSILLMVCFVLSTKINKWRSFIFNMHVLTVGLLHNRPVRRRILVASKLNSASAGARRGHNMRPSPLPLHLIDYVCLPIRIPFCQGP